MRRRESRWPTLPLQTTWSRASRPCCWARSEDAFTAVVKPEDAYGAPLRAGARPRQEALELPKGQEWAAGMPIHTEQDGKPLSLWITEVKGAWIWLTLDHPIAGMTLHFEVQVLGCREATAEEKTHRHAHGVDGHGHHHHH